MTRIYNLCFLMLALFANAQWTTDYNTNTLVSSLTSEAPKSMTTSDGRTYVVFWKKLPSPVNYQLYAQLIDQNGNKSFGDEGILINSAAKMSTYTIQYHLNLDKDNNLYVGLTATGENSKGYIHKITPSGQLAWGANGVVINNIKGYDMKFFPSDHSGVYVTYCDDTLGYINLLDADTAAPKWQQPITVNGPNSNYTFTSVGEGAVLSDDSFVSLIHARQTSDIFSYFFAQRYSTTGQPMWSKMTRLSNRNTMYNSRYSTILENDVLYLGFSGSSDTRFDSYLQRLNADGTTPWGMNGANFSDTDVYYEMNTSIAKEPASNIIWATSRFTPTNQGSNGLYVQKFDKETGARLLTNASLELFSVNANYKGQSDKLQMFGSKPTILLRNAAYNGVQPTPLSIAILKDDGSFLLPNKFVDIATSNTVKSEITFTTAGSNFFAVWQENRSGDQAYGTRTYIQNFDPQAYLAVGNTSKNIKFSAYPNPVTNILTLTSDKKISNTTFYNLEGKLVKTATTESINVEQLTKGVYIMKVTFVDGTTENQKIIKN